MRSWLRVHAAVEDEPQLYAWVLKNTDETVRGRQWITELGLKAARGTIELSCIVKTDEHSTLVSSPVMASQPRVIRYAIKNIERTADADLATSVCGITVKTVGQDVDSYEALLEEIKRRTRDCPIVLVTPTRDGKYLLHPATLQEKLIGLGQVVQIASDFNSYEMADVLGEHRSAWNGAINILFTPSPQGMVRTRLFLSDDIEGWGKTQEARIAQMLAWVTNNTNVSRLLNHVRPEGVMQLALRRQLQSMRARRHEMDITQLRDEVDNMAAAATDQAKWITTVEDDNANLQAQLANTKAALADEQEKLKQQNFALQTLKDQLQQAGPTTMPIGNAEAALKLACRTDPPTPLECLTLIESIYPEFCIVLQNAKDSAGAMKQFDHGKRLLALLQRLVTEYRRKLIDHGDHEARQVFGNNEYAAKESETVMASQSLRRLRTFPYNGKPVEMFRHLKIGIEANTTRTIRVHFHWDANRHKIVIGHCGEHLPISSH